MVAKIKSGKSLIGALNYNENKVKQQKAILIAAPGYPKDHDQLNFYDKLLRLTDLADRNERTKTNTVHISLNFANGENLTDEKLQAICADYMKGISFENQPCLVYRHFDAGHPHIHIVSTNIKSDGYRISLHYLGQNESEKARKAIEIKYNLIKAGDQQNQKPDLKFQAEATIYGKSETKRAITNTLSYVLRVYKFTSVPELNAVLRPFNIQADRGNKDSRMYAHEGLIYCMLDNKGDKVGVPIKASTIYGKPTLKTLKEKFKLNETLRKPFKEPLINTLNHLLARPLTQRNFEKRLNEKGIQVIFRQNDEGRMYGVTFIDQLNKAVFNGSDLGKPYSANALNTYFFLPEPKPQTPLQGHQELRHDVGDNSERLLDILLQPDQDDLGALNKIKRESRKRQKRQNM